MPGMPQDRYLAALPAPQQRAYLYTSAIPDRDRELVQQSAVMFWAIATSDDHEIAHYLSPAYKSARKLLYSLLRRNYRLGSRRAFRVLDGFGAYGPHESLEGTTSRGVESLVQFVLAYPRERLY